ncbi:MAG: peptidase M22, partial [Eubacterium sp.]
YQHINNLPDLFEAIPETIDLKKRLKKIVYSSRPRPQTNSYMPVFRAGIAFGKTIGRTHSINVMEMSHQENHIRSAMYGCNCDPQKIEYPFLATHFSGGTSEILLVKKKKSGYNCRIVGETLDLNAGQLVDRIGVHFGFGFPAGKALETLANQAIKKDCVIASCVEKMNFHFSGQENKAIQYLESGVEPAEVAFGLLRSIAKTLAKTVRYGIKYYGVKNVLFSGGVMSNQIIRIMVEKELECSGSSLYFSKPQYATDNAVGNALLGFE